MTRRGGFLPALLALAASFGVACGGGDGPVGPPTIPPSPTPDPNANFAGTLAATVTGAPVGGATIRAGSVSARTAADGSFSMRLPAGTSRITITAPGHVERATGAVAGTMDARLDVIPDGGSPWSLDFYRELARNGAGGGSLEPLTRWEVEPRFFIDTRPEPTTGDEIPPELVEFATSAIGETVRLLTDGRLQGDRVVATDDPPADMTPGTVVLRWNTAEVAARAGSADAFAFRVGGPSNVVVFRHLDETRAVHHEIGHVLGLFHPLGGYRRSHMWYAGELEPPHFTEWDVFHARVLYARPNGNTDIDVDPPGAVAGRTATRRAGLRPGPGTLSGSPPAPVVCHLVPPGPAAPGR